MASSDLGKLGSKDGSPVAYTWTTPSLMPLLLPWLSVLALLVLKPNRCGQAWWVWAPLGIVAGLGFGLQSLCELLSLQSDGVDLPCQFGSALAFGLAAIWLLAPYLAGKPRPLIFLGMLFAQALFSAVSLAVGMDWESGFYEAAGAFVFLGVTALALALVMTLAGLTCRGRYGVVRVSLWLAGWTLAIWFVVAVPFCIFALTTGGMIPWVAFVLGPLMLAGMSFGMLLPFLILSFVNPFHRERLKGLLRLSEDSAAPPPFPVAPPVVVPA